MKIYTSLHKTTIIIDIIIIVFCAFGVYNISNKAALPLNLQCESSTLVIDKTDPLQPDLSEGDQIITLDNLILKSIEEVEILLDGRSIGEVINLEILREGEHFNVNVKTINYYSPLYNVVAMIVGIMFILVAILVLLKCEIKEPSLVLHWALMFTAMIILMTWGSYSKPTLFLGLITRVGFHMGYIFAPVSFFLFITVFPKRINFNIKRLLQVIILISFLLFIALNYTFFLYIKNKDLVQMRTYITFFDISSLFIILIALSAIILFLHTYISSTAEIERKKIRWILLGFILGPINYVLFWVIPSRLWNDPIIPEPIVLLLVSFVPITFGIAIIKYRILDIDIIFKRGLVYSVVISFLLIIYLGIITLFAKLLNDPESEASSIIAAISIALLFQPIKTKARRFVDEKFFRVEYDYRQSLNSFLVETKDFYTTDLLISRSLEFINNIIPTNNIGFYSYHNGDFKLSNQFDFNCPSDFNIKTIKEEDFHSPLLPIAKQDEIEPEANTQPPPSSMDTISASLFYIIKSSNKIPHGLIVIGKKKSESKFTAEDLDLLTVIFARLSIMLDRIKLQEEVIKEHFETQRLEELNKLKSFFVSSVSHDLKTPITSIKMFAEKLKTSPELSQQQTDSYLNIIEGESNRLTRLIDNVLDYAKIEAGVKKYTFSKTNIIWVIQNVIHTMEYQFTMKNFEIRKEFQKKEIFLNIDADAVSEAIINLLSNSLKYHNEKKIIEVRATQNKTYSILEIKDWGKGISQEDIKNIFVPFFRSDQPKLDKSEGAGLGLAIVKHIVDAHKGKIEVESKLDQGTIIRLLFPIRNYNEKNISN